MRVAGTALNAISARSICRRGFERLLPSATYAITSPPSCRGWCIVLRGGIALALVSGSRRLAPPAARAPLATRRLVGLEHGRALGLASIGEAIPPVGEIGKRPFELAALASKIEKVPRGAIAWMLEQTVRTRSGALLEA